MFSRNAFVRLIFYILMLIFFTAAAVWIFLTPISNVYIAIPILGIFFVATKLIKTFNHVPEKIAYFFNAVENEDSMLHFPEKTNHRPTSEMNKSLNRINLLIQEAKLRNREQEQYYSLLLEQVATGMLVINSNGSVMQANSAAKILLNYQQLNHIDQLKRVDERLHHAFRLLKDGDTHQFVKLAHQNRVTQLALQGTSFVSHGDTLRIISVQDISNEMDAKEIDSWIKLIRVLTHEIMNSITPITSLSETLLRHYVSTDDNVIDEKKIANTVKGLEVINERGAGLIRFVESYRKITKLSKPDLQPIHLKNLLEHLLLLLENEPQFNHIDFRIKIIPETLTIHADEGQMSQVFINLIKNAMQAVEHVEHPQITITAQHKTDGRTEIIFADNGIGIPSELMEHIFIPFFTTKENGSGIGLSLSRQIMKNHGGSIDAFSTPGNTLFTLTL